jgi:hypothetical protein
MSDDKVVAVKSEVQRLLDASVIRHVPQVASEHSVCQKEKCQMEDVHRLHRSHKATPKDNYPLPRMDQVINSAASVAIMSLLDCFSGYH